MGPPCPMIRPYLYCTKQVVQVALSAFENFTSPLELQKICDTCFFFSGICRHVLIFTSVLSWLHVTFLIKNSSGFISGIWYLVTDKRSATSKPNMTDN